MFINERGYKRTLYQIIIGTGTAWTKEFKVHAYNEKEAIDLLADYLEEEEMDDLYGDHYSLLEYCDMGQTVDEYAKANNLTCCGSHRIYLKILEVQIMKVKNNE